MDEKSQILIILREEFSRWQELLASLSDEQITSPWLPANLSVKDVVAHLMAWQQVSNARLEAARSGGEPAYPAWLAGRDPESEEDIDQFNATIHETYRRYPWRRVYQEWRDGYLHLLQLAEELPASDLLVVDRYSWLPGYALLAVLKGTYEHHHDDHLEPLLAWLRQPGNQANAKNGPFA